MAQTTAHDRAFFGHPRGLSTLFFTEMWERFSYYGMRALLLLYMTAPLSAGGLGFNAADGGAIYGLYTSMVYLATLPGGWIADRLIGLFSMLLFACLMMLPNRVLLFQHERLAAIAWLIVAMLLPFRSMRRVRSGLPPRRWSWSRGVRGSHAASTVCGGI